MKLLPWTFTPTYQPDPENNLVTFQLRPLDWATAHELQRSFNARHVASADGAAAAFRHSVIGWKGTRLHGEPLEFSGQAKRQVLQEGDCVDPAWSVWVMEITNELYTKSFLQEAERKNS